MLSPLVKTSPANAGGAGSVPGWGANPNSTCLTAKGKKKKTSQNTKQKQCCNKFNRDFKNGPRQKNKN